MGSLPSARLCCLKAEDALEDSFAGEGRRFVNLAQFESLVGQIADCVLIFPESVGSYAEAGFFANSDIKKKTLIVNRSQYQAAESFLNLGPIHTFNVASLLTSTLVVSAHGAADFAPIAERLRHRIKWPKHRERLSYKRFGQFNFKEKLLVVFEMLRLLKLTKLPILREALAGVY